MRPKPMLNVFGSKIPKSQSYVLFFFQGKVVRVPPDDNKLDGIFDQGPVVKSVKIYSVLCNTPICLMIPASCANTACPLIVKHVAGLNASPSKFISDNLNSG